MYTCTSNLKVIIITTKKTFICRKYDMNEIKCHLSLEYTFSIMFLTHLFRLVIMS